MLGLLYLHDLLTSCTMFKLHSCPTLRPWMYLTMNTTCGERNFWSFNNLTVNGEVPNTCIFKLFSKYLWIQLLIPLQQNKNGHKQSMHAALFTLWVKWTLPGWCECGIIAFCVHMEPISSLISGFITDIGTGTIAGGPPFSGNGRIWDQCKLLVTYGWHK